ncbi:MAG: threonine synthase [Elusimicrobia bacterium]|nr:threonine synthase [Elusimicrobiota bacterium]
MKYYSTNGKSRPATFREALFTGLADDGGLFMPEAFPNRGNNFPRAAGNNNFHETAFKVCREYISDVADKDLKEIIRDSFSRKAFPVKNSPSPLVRLAEDLYILELFHGPTLSFKDFGARFMARLMKHYLAGSKKRLAVIVATSGDTGSAAACGFFGLPGINVFVLYPEGRISPLQEKQIATLGGNITALKVRGDFDDCQRLAKKALSDAGIRGKMALSSANSINIGRLLPQMFYYFSAVSQLKVLSEERGKRKPVFVVPSGNFGDLSAGLFAKRMGLPVRKFIAAVNINSGVPRYLATGILPRAKTRMTLSSAMDVGIPSNFTRILDLYHNDRIAVKRDIDSVTVTDAEIEKTIRMAFRRFCYVSDPHTATGIAAALNCNIAGPKIVLATAHPAKFPDIVSRNTGLAVKAPSRLASCMRKRDKSSAIPADFNRLKTILLSHVS